MDEKVYLEKLEKREIKPTAMRLLILKAMTLSLIHISEPTRPY